jgi:hypothetical protein
MQNNMTTKHSPPSMNIFLVYEIWELDVVVHQEFQKLESKDMKMEVMHKV